MKFLKYFFGAIAMILLAIAFGWVVMWLWNALIPQLFGGPILNWTQAVGILVLARLLTGGFGKGWGGHHRCRDCGHSGWKSRKSGHWKQRWEEKMSNMSPEERERCKAKMKRWCGDWEEPEHKQSETMASPEEPKN